MNFSKLLLITSLIGSILLQNQIVDAATFTTLDKLSVENSPLSSKLKQKLPQAPLIAANKPDFARLAKEDKKREKDGLPYRFAIPVVVDTEPNKLTDFTKAGKWEIRGDTAVWRLKVTGNHVKSYNFGLKNIFFPKGTRLFFYTDDYFTVLGPYTDRDNKSQGELWSPILESSSVTMEINIPVKMQPLLQFEIAKINQGYRGIRNGQVTKSGSCNNDVVCSEASAWSNEIRSVARYTISGAFLCTGTLLNNVRGDHRPYFLTADHCGANAATSPSLVFYWNYETSVCDGTPDGQLNQFQNGASYRAGWSTSDFALVELDEMPENSFNVFWSGWDNSNIAPSSAVGIHHPGGDEKRISFDDDPLIITNPGENVTIPDGTHLRIGAWDDGTTEGGSSGSGIWNPAHHLVGTLTGGFASCDSPTESDWYGRMAVHWEGNGVISGQAKVWLDPDNTGATNIDGVDTCTAPVANITTSPSIADINQPTNFASNVTGGVAPYTYHWDFNGDGITDSNDPNPLFSYSSLFQGNIRLTAVDSANCTGVDSTAIVVNNGGNEIFPLDGQIPSDWNVPSGANSGWSVENSSAFEGDFSLKSNAITDNQTASIEVTQDFSLPSNNFVSFAFKVSSESGFDKLSFHIDDVLYGAWSGDTSWVTVFYPLETGSHTLRWSYQKDESASGGSDTAWIDGVTGITLPASNGSPSANVLATTIEVIEGNLVTLDASSSSDPDNDPLSFQWQQTTGDSVTLTAATSSITTFTAPIVSAPTSLTFLVTVTDTDGNSDTETVTVNVANTPGNAAPVATVAQSSITTDEGSAVSLDASLSSDPDGDALTFEWNQTAGPAVTLTGVNSATATFTAPNVTSNALLTFTVTVTDPFGGTSNTIVNVTVRDTPPPAADGEDGGGGGGSTNVLLLSVLLLLTQRKKIR